MGNSKSEQYSSLVKERDPKQWAIIDELQGYQLWQSKVTFKKYLAYSIDIANISNEQKLELYSFRKQNHISLVTAQHLLINGSNFFCTEPRYFYLLVENIPHRLCQFRRSLNFKEGLVVLSAAFTGYNTLYLIYGPLYTSDKMICFSENGRPKVWISQNLSSNQPGKSHLNFSPHESAIQRLNQNQRFNQQLTLKDKTQSCVKHLIYVVQSSLQYGFPNDFKAKLNRVKTFGEGQELIASFCREESLQLNQIVNMEAKHRIIRQRAFSQKSRETINASEHSNIPQEQNYFKGYIHKHISQTPIYSLSNSHNIPLLPLVHLPQKPTQYSSRQSNLPQKNLSSSNLLKLNYNQINHLNSINQPKVNIVRPNLQTLYPTSISEIKSVNNNKISINESIKNDTQVSKENVDKVNPNNLKKIQFLISNSVKSQQSVNQSYPQHIQQPSQHEVSGTAVIHTVSDQSLEQPNIVYAQKKTNPSIPMEHTESKDFQGCASGHTPPPIADQLILWQKSLLKMSDKMDKPQFTKQERETYFNQICHHSQAMIPYQQQNLSQDELLQQIRNKYSQYLSSQQPAIKIGSNIPESFYYKNSFQYQKNRNKPAYSKSANYDQAFSEYHPNQHQRKVTFGQSKSINYQDAFKQRKQLQTSRSNKQKNEDQTPIKIIRKDIIESKGKNGDIDKLYAKYVKNKINKSKDISKQVINSTYQQGRKQIALSNPIPETTYHQKQGRKSSKSNCNKVKEETKTKNKVNLTYDHLINFLKV